jgi:hypothetical protein
MQYGHSIRCLILLFLLSAWPVFPAVLRLSGANLKVVRAAWSPSFDFDPADRKILEEKIALCDPSKPMQERVLTVARSFLGVPYVHGALEKKEEILVINLRALDCWTFVENSMAVALAAAIDDEPSETFPQFVQQLRYWGGKIDGYGSRLHYFSSWLIQAQQLGYLKDITAALPGAIPLRKSINFMSTHPNAYPALRNPEILRQVEIVEQRLSRHAWYYIPQHKVAAMEEEIKDGDIIAITSGKLGLDIAHEGFALRVRGRVHLLHASSLGKRVVISALPLAEYLIAQKGQTGILVARM